MDILLMALGKYLSQIHPDFIDEKTRFKKIEINEIPIMLCEDSSICCIPKETEVFSAAFVGASGYGKSLLFHRVCSHLFYLWKDNLTMMYDVSEETIKWSKLMNVGVFNDFNLLIGQTPCSLPMVYLYLNSNTLKNIYEFNSLKIVLPFSEIIDNIEFFLRGVNPGYDIGNSGVYINNISNKLSECDTQLQVKEVLEEELPKERGFQAMRTKIKNSFDSLFNEQILDITNPEYPAYLKINTKNREFSNPFSALMKVGVIPSLITSDLTTKKYQSEVIAFYTDAIFQNNVNEFGNKRTFLAFDELWNLCKNDQEPASMAIGRIASRGRMNNVGLLYVTQFYDKIPDSVKGAKLNYCFAFQTTDERARKISGDFDLNKRMRQMLINLKKFECIAMTKNKFVFYRDGERWEDNKPVKGVIFYPLSGHKKPGEK